MTSEGEPTSRNVLEALGISKSYGAVQALADVSLHIREGEVVGLVGDNGAGKSTLIKCIGGVLAQSTGEIRVGGESLNAGDPQDARRHGIETIHQNLNLIETMNVSQNFFLNREVTSRFGLLNLDQMQKEATLSLQEFGVDIGHTGRRVSELSGGQRQMVAVVRAVHWQARIVMMDEPTAALGVQQSERVLQLTGQLSRKGVSVLFVSHNMDHIMRVCDRVVVLSRGRKVADVRKADTSINEVVRYITGIDERVENRDERFGGSAPGGHP